MSNISNNFQPASSIISIRCVKRQDTQLIDMHQVEAILASESNHKGSMIYEKFSQVEIYMQSGNVFSMTIPEEKLEKLQATFCYFKNTIKTKTPVPPMPMPQGTNLRMEVTSLP